MVVIHKMEQPVLKLYAPASGDDRDVYVGEVTSYAQWLDVKRQVAEEGVSGYYAMLDGETVSLDSNGVEDHIPDRWFPEMNGHLDSWLAGKTRGLVDAYSPMVEKETIGCGLGAYSGDLERESVKAAESLFREVVGDMPDGGDEYALWYRRMLVFCEIAGVVGMKYSHYRVRFRVPEELEHGYGVRD